MPVEPEFPTRGSAAGILANLFASGGGPGPEEARSADAGRASAASDADKGRADPGGHARIGDATLSWEDEALTTALRRLPALRSALAAGRPGRRRLDVSALVLEDRGGGPTPLDPADAAVFAEGGDPVLGWADLPEGLRGGFAWEPRWPALAWLARTARERGAALELRICHERGDHLYELVLWRFDAGQSLFVKDFDGGERPLRRGEAHRRPPPAAEPVFGQLAEALRRAGRWS